MLDIIFSLKTLWWLMLLLYLPACIGLIVIVLLQKGKGVGFAGAFGVGSGSDALFGPRSARSLPQRLTYIAAGLFMVLALVMSMLSGKLYKGVAPEQVDEAALQESAMMQEVFAGEEAKSDDAAAEAAEQTPATAEEATATEEAAATTEESAAATEATDTTPASEAQEEAPAETPAQ